MAWRGSENARTVFILLPLFYCSYSIGGRTPPRDLSSGVETGCIPSPVYKTSDVHNGKPHGMSCLT